MHGSAYSAQSPGSGKLVLDPVTEPGATIYSQAGCKGSSFGMAMGFELSEEADAFAVALIQNGVMSAWVPEESEVILNEDQLTEHKLRGTGQCIDFPASYAATSVKFGEIVIEYVSAPTEHVVNTFFAQGGRTMVIAHRGLNFGPENSLMTI